MKKKIFGGIAVLAIVAVAAFNVNMGSANSLLGLVSLDSIEAIAAETRCISSSGSNTGACKKSMNGSGDACVTAGTWDSKNCYSHE